MHLMLSIDLLEQAGNLSEFITLPGASRHRLLRETRTDCCPTGSRWGEDCVQSGRNGWSLAAALAVRPRSPDIFA